MSVLEAVDGAARRARRARGAARRPRGALRPGAGQAAQPAVRRARRGHARPRGVDDGSAATSRPPASWPARTSPSRRRPSGWPSGWASSRTGCATCWCRARPRTPRTRSWRSSPARAARSRRCSPATCCACTPGTPSSGAGAPSSSTPPPSDLGGFKSVTVAVKAKGTPAPGEAPYALLKFEGGVHRVQRVPVTESQGRVHTSAAGVLVMPEAEPVDVTVDDKDLRIDVFRSSGPGGQSVNTTDSAVRITHLPTGPGGQLPEREVPAAEQGAGAAHPALAAAPGSPRSSAQAEASDARRSQVRTVDRSERIRTYNFPENRISDHRTGFKAYNLDHGPRRRARPGRRVVRGGRPRVPPRGARGVSESAARAAPRGRDAAGRRRRGLARQRRRRAAGPRARASRGARLLLRETVPDDVADRFRELVARRAGPRAAAAPDGLRRLPLPRAGRRARASSCPDRRPSCWPGGRSSRPRAVAPPTGRDPVVVDLCTGSGAVALSVATEVPGSQRPRRRAGRAGGDVGRAQPGRQRGRPPRRRHGRAASPTSTAPSTWSSPTRPTSRWRPTSR